MENTESKEELAARQQARRDFIIKCREEGMGYEAIGKKLERAGHGPNVGKQRIYDFIKANRPDLMGSVTRRQAWRKK